MACAAWARARRPLATEALARNPGAQPGIFLFLFLGLAFIESLALYTFAIIFLYVK